MSLVTSSPTKWTATRFGQTDAGLLCHVVAPGDGRTPEVRGNFRAGKENCHCQNHFGMDEATLDRRQRCDVRNKQ